MSPTILMDKLQVVVWPPEKIEQSACLADINHPATKNDHTENKVKNNVRRDVSVWHESFDASFTHSSG